MATKDSEPMLALVQRLSVDSQISEDELTSAIVSLTTACQVPSLQNPNVSYSAEDFADVARNAEMQLSVICKMLEYIFCRVSEGRQFSPLFLKNIVVCCYLCACAYSDESWEWSDLKTANLSAEALKKLCEVVNCTSVPELLTGTKATFPTSTASQNMTRAGGYLQHILQRLSEMLNKKTWRSYPGLKMCYWVTLQHLDWKSLGDHLAYLLPPALFIIDDWEQKHKILGLRCLRHILNNTVGGKLRWYGRATVIYDALKPLLYSREPEVLEMLYPTIIQALYIIEADPAHSGKFKKESCYESLLEQLLRDMAYEQQLTLRAVYAAVLPQVLKGMGIYAIRWSEDLMNVCTDYLATFDGPEATDRINILKGVQVYARECWPRVHVDAESILKMIVRLVYDVTLEDCGINTHSLEVILEECKTVFRLVQCAAPDTTRRLCRGLDSLTFHTSCQDHLQKLMMVASSQTS